MALSLGVSTGTRLQVGESLVEVEAVSELNRMLRINVAGRRMLVTDKERTEIGPDVFVSYGENRRRERGGTRARIAIEAPRSVGITRL